MPNPSCIKSVALFLIVLLSYPIVVMADTDKRSEIDSLLVLSEKLGPSNPDSAILLATEALKNEKELSSGVSAYGLKILADAYYYKNNILEAVKYYQQSADKEKEVHGHISNSYAARINDVGYCYYLMGYYEMAVTKNNEALQILRQTNNKEELYVTLNNIGTVYFKWGEYAKSIVFFEQTLEHDLESGDPYSLCVTYNNIGKVYESSKNPDKAIKYLELALEQAKLAGNLRMEATILSNLGMIYFASEHLDKAQLFLEEAMSIDKKTGNKFKLAIRENELSKILAAKGKLAEAIEYCQSALVFFKSANIRESQSIVLLDLGRYYQELKQFKNSEDSYLEGLKITEEIKSNYHAMLISEGLSQLYELWGKTDLSLKFYKQYTDYNTEIFNAEKHRQLADFEIKYHTRETEIENQLLKNENEAKQNRLILLTVASLALLIVVFLLIYGVHYKNKSGKQQKMLAEFELLAKEEERKHMEDNVFAEKHINQLQRQKHSSEIEYKNKLLANSTLDLIQKNEFLVDLKAKLANGHSAENFSSKDIINLINQNIDIDQNWKKFSLEFDQIHPHFIDQLNVRFPDLSEIFTQLCAFLRIDLSSKEIAQLQNVSIAAVNKNRQRLRKKLDLAAEADLTEFLKELG